MTQATPKKLKAQCVSCRKTFGGTLEKLQAAKKCPSCGAGDNWWRPVETRAIYRQRVQAEQQGAQWQPPPPPAGAQQQWVPWQNAPGSYVALRLCIAGFVLAPVGLITGPIAIWKAIDNESKAKAGEPSAEDISSGLAIVLGLACIAASIYATWVLYLIATGQWK